MNLVPIRRSRTLPLPGDIFLFRLHKLGYGAGRVIRNDVIVVDWGPCYLVYLYSGFYSKREQAHASLDRNRLLIPPEIVVRSPWTMGYFATAGHRELLASDVFSPHCFQDGWTGQYCDERGNKLPRRIEPCGLWAIGNYRTVDYAISKVLGLPVDED